MTEWLTENARRAYPLEHEWPEALTDAWTPVLLDACVGCDWLPDEGDIRLLDIRKTEEGISFHIGSPDDAPDQSSRQVEVIVRTGPSGRISAYAAGPHVKAILTVSGQAVSAARDTLTDFNWHDVDTPFALRCCSYATKRVTAVEAYAPDDDRRCSRPVWPDGRNLVKTATGDVVLVSKDGLDIDVTQMAPLEGDLLRLSSVTAPLALRAADKPVDLMIRGDACVQVEAIPGVDAAGAPLADEHDGGIVRITEKCKPCCQCEDYQTAFDALKPGNDAVEDLNTEFADILGTATSGYIGALALLEQVKVKAEQRINGYSHVVASAVAVASGGITPDVTAKGTRCRLSVNLTVVNMTLKAVTVSGVSFSGMGAYSPATVPSGTGTKDKVHWDTAGKTPLSGDSLGTTWTLEPGDTLAIVATYAKTGLTNTADKPLGMKAHFTARIVGLTDAKDFEVDVT